MSLSIYNTGSRQKEVFTPLQANQVSLYVCGVTVYDLCHIGHARVMVVFDTVVRHLRSLGYKVNYVRNITDIDDKIIQRALQNQESIQSLTTRMISQMHADEAVLNVQRPTQEPKATEFMDSIQSMIQTLIDKGFAYRSTNGDVYFKVDRFTQYGKLSGKNLEELQTGARIDVNAMKENPLDFVLWKASKENEPSWPSAWGEGRPGWHIECSAMATQCLGNHIDIHGGGLDLSFPHHENEIAQSECATGEHYVNTWMHCGFVRIDNEKMSKSLNNFFTIQEVLKYYHPEVIRYFLLASHYRSPVNYSEENLNTAKASVTRLYSAIAELPVAPLEKASQPQFKFASDAKQASVAAQETQALRYQTQFLQAMNEDFNTPKALAVLFECAKEVNKTASQELAKTLVQLANQLGLLMHSPEQFLKAQPNASELSDAQIEALVTERDAARKSKDFARSDEIRDQLKQQGIELLDNAGKTQWRKK